MKREQQSGDTTCCTDDVCQLAILSHPLVSPSPSRPRTMSDIPDNAPAPRLCVVTKWPDFEGYGFNLHAEKSKPGQYIGKVDAASPAEVAGLLEGDRIVEVNGVNIANENHKQVRCPGLGGDARDPGEGVARRCHGRNEGMLAEILLCFGVA